MMMRYNPNKLFSPIDNVVRTSFFLVLSTCANVVSNLRVDPNTASWSVQIVWKWENSRKKISLAMMMRYNEKGCLIQ
ncbi:hypothetical protein BC829DRAFT_403696 [Chytridium lagenaria]|nr:hypothetical protein BC829DRAFT_403696 [Chytridium lagenaria]